MSKLVVLWTGLLNTVVLTIILRYAQYVWQVAKSAPIPDPAVTATSTGTSSSSTTTTTTSLLWSQHLLEVSFPDRSKTQVDLVTDLMYPTDFTPEFYIEPGQPLPHCRNVSFSFVASSTDGMLVIHIGRFQNLRWWQLFSEQCQHFLLILRIWPSLQESDGGSAVEFVANRLSASYADSMVVGPTPQSLRVANTLWGDNTSVAKGLLVDAVASRHLELAGWIVDFVCAHKAEAFPVAILVQLLETGPFHIVEDLLMKCPDQGLHQTLHHLPNDFIKNCASRGRDELVERLFELRAGPTASPTQLLQAWSDMPSSLRQRLRHLLRADDVLQAAVLQHRYDAVADVVETAKELDVALHASESRDQKHQLLMAVITSSIESGREMPLQGLMQSHANDMLDAVICSSADTKLVDQVVDMVDNSTLLFELSDDLQKTLLSRPSFCQDRRRICLALASAKHDFPLVKQLLVGFESDLGPEAASLSSSSLVMTVRVASMVLDALSDDDSLARNAVLTAVETALLSRAPVSKRSDNDAGIALLQSQTPDQTPECIYLSLLEARDFNANRIAVLMHRLRYTRHFEEVCECSGSAAPSMCLLSFFAEVVTASSRPLVEVASAAETASAMSRSRGKDGTMWRWACMACACALLALVTHLLVVKLRSRRQRARKVRHSAVDRIPVVSSSMATTFREAAAVDRPSNGVDWNQPGVPDEQCYSQVNAAFA